MEIDVTRLVTDLEPSDLSASVAERGKNAGPETWGNSVAAVTGAALMDDDEREEAREFFKGFGAWEADEIAAWSAEDVDALVLQYAAGDLREVQSLCPGDGLGDVDWDEAEKLAHAGTVSGSVYASGDRLYVYIGN